MKWNSQYFALDELLFSSTADRLHISNTPPLDVLTALADTAERMDGVRRILGHPVHVDSGYRCPALNRAVGGSESSAHLTGHAVDFICAGYGTTLEVCKLLASSGIRFDQCIMENSWTHVSFDPRMRQQVLTAKFGAGPTTYHVGL